MTPTGTRSRLHVVTGKGGTGKTTVAAALALALALTRQARAAVRGRGPPGHRPALRRTAAALRGAPHRPGPDDGGDVYALAIDAESALLEYLALYYRLGARRQGARPLRRHRLRHHHRARAARRAADRQGLRGGATATAATSTPACTTPSCSTPRRPAGSPSSSTSTASSPSSPRSGPIKQPGRQVMQLLRSRRTAVHLVTVLEDMPVQETARRHRRARRRRLPVGGVSSTWCRPEDPRRRPRATQALKGKLPRDQVEPPS